jgi:hypothetical protein
MAGELYGIHEGVILEGGGANKHEQGAKNLPYSHK